MSRVTLTNPFDLLTDENEDRTNVPTPKKEQKPAAAAAKPAAKPAATTAAKPAAKTEGAKAPTKPADAKPAAAKPSTGNSANQVVKPAPPRDANTNLQERDKETRAPRDKRDRPARPVGEGKRPFDRKSGTGRPKNEQVRGGHGRGNWGGEVDAKEGVEALKDKEEKTEEKEEGEETKEEKPAVEGEKKEGEAAKEEGKEAAPKEEEVFTYDEYLKSRKAKAPQVEALKPRTVTDSDFGAAGFVPLQREGENGAAAPKKEKKDKPAAEKAEKPAADKKATKEEKNLAAKLLTFASHQDVKRQERGSFRQYDDRERRGPGAGGERRGGDRGGRRENPRGPRPDRAPQGGNNANAAAQPPVQEKDFPALGPHGSDPVKA